MSKSQKASDTLTFDLLELVEKMGLPNEESSLYFYKGGLKNY